MKNKSFYLIINFEVYQIQLIHHGQKQLFYFFKFIVFIIYLQLYLNNIYYLEQSIIVFNLCEIVNTVEFEK
jgi:hypothetical protein